jgi:hypothetical protein
MLPATSWRRYVEAPAFDGRAIRLQEYDFTVTPRRRIAATLIETLQFSPKK